jgi:outer membrane protein assembly factor BamB
VYVVDGNNFYALNGSSGSVNQQRVFTGEEEVSNVAVDNDYGIVYCATTENNIYAYSTDLMVEQWSYVSGKGCPSPYCRFTCSCCELDTFSLGTELSSDGAIYFSIDCDARYDLSEFYAFNRTGSEFFNKNGCFGAIHWTVFGPGTRNLVYLTDGTAVFSFNATTGQAGWTFPVTANGFPAVFGADGTAFVTGTDNQFYALDGDFGTIRWNFSYVPGHFQPMLGLDGAVYIATANHTVYALDGGTGTVLWELVVDSTPCIVTSASGTGQGARGWVHVQSSTKLYTLGASGALRWVNALQSDLCLSLGTADTSFTAVNNVLVALSGLF